MTNDNDKSGSPLHPTKISVNQFKTELQTQLSALQDSHENANACFRFFFHAIESLSNPTHDQPDPERWHFGLWLTGRWIDDLHEQQLQQIIAIKSWLNDAVITKD